MKKTSMESPRPLKASQGSTAKQAPKTPHPQQDLTGIRLRIAPIPERVYDHVMKRDARIFERLAKV